MRRTEAETGIARVPSGKRTAPRGRLILVTCADLGRLDVVLGAVVRRLGRKDVVRTEPVVTRALPAGGGMVVSRGTLAAFEADGALCLSWRCGGRTLGYTRSLLDRLAEGAIVVAGAGVEVESAARALWSDVSVVRLLSGTETLRASLASLGVPQMEGCYRQVRDVGDLASAVHALSRAIEQQLPPVARARPPKHAPIAPRIDEPAGQRPRVADTVRRRASRAPIAAAGLALEPQVRVASPT